MIRLRLGVGMEPVQRFFFVCGACKAPTRGALYADKPPKLRLEVEGSTLLDGDLEQFDQSISIHPDFPAVPNAESMERAGGSAFIMHHQILGDRILEYENRVAQFNGIVRGDWLQLRHLTQYYLERDWKHFDLAASKIGGDKVRFNGLNRGQQRHHVQHALYDLFLYPMWVVPLYVDLKREWNDLWIRTGVDHKAVLEFAKGVAAEKQLLTVQADLFDCIGRYVDARYALFPALAVEMYPAEVQETLPTMRLFRDDYELLRDLYIQSFEACHHVLRYVVGGINVAIRGSATAFADAKDEKGKPRKPPKSLAAFDTLVNARKIDWIDELTRWKREWPNMLDRDLRNSLGHRTIRHDLGSGMLVEDEGTSISYVEFVVKAHRLIHPLLLATNVLKIVSIWGSGSKVP